MILPCRSQVMTVLMWFNERSVLILRVAVMMRYNTNKVLYRLLSFSLLLCIRQHWLPDGCTIISDSFRFSGSDASPFSYLRYHPLAGWCIRCCFPSGRSPGQPDTGLRRYLLPAPLCRECYSTFPLYSPRLHWEPPLHNFSMQPVSLRQLKRRYI